MVPIFPTALTWLRISLIPVFVGIYYVPEDWMSPALRNWVGMAVFALAAITDWLDGYLARRWGETSAFGAFLDPVADKLMVATALVLLVGHDTRAFLVITAIVIIGREITVSALREWMAQLGARGKVAVSGMGKLKTILQMTGLSMMMFRNDLLGFPVYEIGVALLVVAAVLTLWSMGSYMQAAWPELRRDRVP